MEERLSEGEKNIKLHFQEVFTNGLGLLEGLKPRELEGMVLHNNIVLICLLKLKGKYIHGLFALSIFKVHNIKAWYCCWNILSQKTFPQKATFIDKYLSGPQYVTWVFRRLEVLVAQSCPC